MSNGLSHSTSFFSIFTHTRWMRMFLWSILFVVITVRVESFQRVPSSSSSPASTELFCKIQDGPQRSDHWAGLNTEWAGYPISSIDSSRNSLKSAAMVAATTTIGLHSFFHNTHVTCNHTYICILHSYAHT